VSKAFTREDDQAADDAVLRRPAVTAAHLTPEGAQRLRDELNELLQQRSNSTNTDAIERRIQELRLTLASATIVAPHQHDEDTVRFGATVTVRDSDGEMQYRIVGPAEADPARGWITAASPLGQALLNKRAGDKVLFKFPAGQDTLEILSVFYGSAGQVPG
jgi:transcription elongation GreA/GreB family factor